MLDWKGKEHEGARSAKIAKGVDLSKIGNKNPLVGGFNPSEKD